MQDARRTTRGALGPVLIATALALTFAGSGQAGELSLRNAANQELAFITHLGNMTCTGYVAPQARLHQWTSELNPRDGVAELIVTNAAGDFVALFDPLRKNVYLRGNIYQQSAVTPSSLRGELIIRNSAGTAKAMITEDGDLYLAGTLTEGQTITERETLYHCCPVVCVEIRCNTNFSN
jgi:hypothetical protein